MNSTHLHITPGRFGGDYRGILSEDQKTFIKSNLHLSRYDLAQQCDVGVRIISYFLSHNNLKCGEEKTKPGYFNTNEFENWVM